MDSFEQLLFSNNQLFTEINDIYYLSRKERYSYCLHFYGEIFCKQCYLGWLTTNIKDKNTKIKCNQILDYDIEIKS